ncbi:MAG TPA: hypothetical protein VK789_08540 [Bryobacteraceae bacterium]|nr:hypothetical protein [Bryobacteraceae bacterium]
MTCSSAAAGEHTTLTLTGRTSHSGQYLQHQHDWVGPIPARVDMFHMPESLNARRWTRSERIGDLHEVDNERFQH